METITVKQGTKFTVPTMAELMQAGWNRGKTGLVHKDYPLFALKPAHLLLSGKTLTCKQPGSQSGRLWVVETTKASTAALKWPVKAFLEMTGKKVAPPSTCAHLPGMTPIMGMQICKFCGADLKPVPGSEYVAVS